MKLTMTRTEVAFFEEKVLDFRQTDVVDPKRIGLGPVLAVGQADVEMDQVARLTGMISSTLAVALSRSLQAD
jgi:hypothetical protein